MFKCNQHIDPSPRASFARGAYGNFIKIEAAEVLPETDMVRLRIQSRTGADITGAILTTDDAYNLWMALGSVLKTYGMIPER